MSNLENKGAGEQTDAGCTALTYQSAAVSVPISVKPKVSTGNITTFCCGEPIISPSLYKILCGSKSGSCNFILTQNICIEIPIEISAEAFTGCPYIDCKEASGKEASGKECEACGG